MRALPFRGYGRGAVLLLVAGSWLALAGPGHAGPAASEPPNDPLFRHQWNLRAIQIPQAWAVSRGSGATVAVLDTGVAYEDRGRYRRAPDLAGTRFAAGWDFVDDDPYPDDVAPADGRRSHGTAIAGIIAQTTGNAIGAAGVAPAATIMPVRVLRPDLSGSGDAIARGLRFAADHGADVANLSIAGPSPTRALSDAVEYAVAKGTTVVAASGNDGRPSVSWPAAHPSAVAVGAVGRDLTLARYSNYGGPLDLVAPAGAGDLTDTGFGPGDGVAAQTLKGGPARFCFCFMASTSAAAAHVSGVAALLVGSGRARSPARVRSALREAARDLGPRGSDTQYGAGLAQAADALSAAGGGTRDPGASWTVPALSLAGAALAALVLVGIRRRRNAA